MWRLSAAGDDLLDPSHRPLSCKNISVLTLHDSLLQNHIYSDSVYASILSPSASVPATAANTKRANTKAFHESSICMGLCKRTSANLTFSLSLYLYLCLSLFVEKEDGIE